MLLRLLPVPTAEQPAPPTILFTLPLPVHPYTSKSLPLPANLHAHRSVCLQEDIDCSNVLLGEKSSWIGGIIDEVTFSMAAQEITVRYIDNSFSLVPLTPECTVQLGNVIQQVHLSFQPAPAPASTTDSAPRASTSSAASVSSAASSASGSSTGSSTSGHRRTPSSLLFSFLSPLLSSNQSQAAATRYQSPVPTPQPPARVHRRLARSLLVDAYRRHVLPALKEQLPSAYLLWQIASETARHHRDFESLKVDIQTTLGAAGVNASFATPMKRSHSGSSSSESSSQHSGDLSESDSDEGVPVTPATSIFSPSSSECSSPLQSPRRRMVVNPSAYLLTLPPAPTVPDSHRTVYSSQLARLSLLVTRLSSIKKLNAKYEREEGKRRWLESLERGRAGDRALRKAYSNKEPTPNVRLTAEPIKRSGLWRSWTLDDQMRAEVKEAAKAALHPAMMESIDEVAVTSDDDTEDDHSQASGSTIRHNGPRIYIPPTVEEDIDDAAATIMVCEQIIHVSARPSLERANEEEEDEEDEIPTLSPPSSPSASSSDTEEEPSTPAMDREDDLFTPPSIDDICVTSSSSALMGAPLSRSKSRLETNSKNLPQIKSIVGWGGVSDDAEVEEVETYAGVEVIYA
ncbi:hypothetical protein BD324DRAFT_606724 [Kockovaella imperatae]|uniref:Uncharacterized protein n=1 Tax=Kockovaella imperatae TaxID=4999 RepID=A0A1Y1UTT4_9TREE|nr:hypothetical protein BD324DRAFT_606724 [Kockovaella imperatae]ORX41027.1 hypothetical protein BD324DRAFT_606724 [Kockovaella imperatae]